eukprot:CAMPEP_0206022724 /NCGR_PEP_ID=MMETSP1464-20131121/35191_1 /ASSEMBLY_ACC=CAM_ASM_001124 /TAXON_ID=119497 /ORGANISM="Exanthemachrysis gayraliae, Strain RCC1523" /LENGTH=37 /DNA_ID= /DNA_START= /DNA_END= /DNA_ORIENTATION=
MAALAARDPAAMAGRARTYASPASPAAVLYAIDMGNE